MVLRGAPAPSRCVQRRSERKKNPATFVAGFLNVQWKDQRLLNFDSPKCPMLNVRKFLRFLLDFQRKSAFFRCI